tara:strand:- start:557 stop:1714 length:1158 start_codon:yes stop_codon:yes gene_type:complete
MSDKFRYTAGLNNVGSYQVSGKTFITASTVNDGEEDQIEFPDVTNNIKVKLDSSGGQQVSMLQVQNDYALQSTSNIAEPVEASEGFTLSFWFKTPSSMTRSGTQTVTYAFPLNPQPQQGYQIRIDTNSNLQARYMFYSDPSDNFNVNRELLAIGSSVVLQADTVYNTVLVVSGGAASSHSNDSFHFYLNAVSQGSDSPSNTNYAHGEFGRIQINTPSGSPKFSPISYTIWRTALSALEISSLYNGGNYVNPTSIRNSDIALLWNFDQNDSSSPLTEIKVIDEIQSHALVDNNLDGGEIYTFSTHTFGGGGGELRIHYRSKDFNNVISQKHYWTLDSQYESIKMNVKSKELYLSADGGNCDYSISAELTNIPTSSMFQHTGSGVDE